MNFIFFLIFHSIGIDEKHSFVEKSKDQSKSNFLFIFNQ